MTARKPAPLVPPEMRELLGLLGELAQQLPMPADRNWDRRDDVRVHRLITLDIRIASLLDQLRICDLYPSIDAKLLADHCRQSAKAIRAILAEPLGYEPKPEPEPEPEPGKGGAK